MEFSETKLSFAQNFYKIWYSNLWEFLLFKLPKEIKDTKGNISMHCKTSLTIIRLNLVLHYNMDGRHETTDTTKKKRLEAPKYAQPLSVNDFSLEASLCCNKIFSWQTFTHYSNKRGLGRVSQLMIHVDSKLREKRICKIIMLIILKSNFQVQGHETWISKSECGQS